MRKFIKNKKSISIFVLIVFSFLFLFTFWVKAVSDDCKKDCTKCSIQADCESDEMKAYCSWDKTKCCDKLDTDWPSSPMGTPLNGCSALPDMVKYLYEWGVTLGGLVAFIALIMAGFQYLTSVGDPSKMKEAQSRIVSAILGLVLLLGSWLILNTINPALTTFNNVTFNPQEILSGGINWGGAKAKPCDFVVFWKDKNYQGDKRMMSGDGDIYEVDTPPIDWAGRSVKSYIACKPCSAEQVQQDASISDTDLKKCKQSDNDPNVYYEKECDRIKIIYNLDNNDPAYYKEGGACTIQFSSAAAWPWDACGDRIGEVYAKHPDFGKVTDQSIVCEKLVMHNTQDYQDNHAPVLNPIGDKSVKQGETLKFFISAADIDGDPLNYWTIQLPTGAVFNEKTLLFSWTPTAGQAGGDYFPSFYVADDSSATDWEQIHITVEP